MGGHGLDLSNSGKGQVAASSKQGSEPLDSIKSREFLDSTERIRLSRMTAEWSWFRSEITNIPVYLCNMRKQVLSVGVMHLPFHIKLCYDLS
jgi:hypothetical protein